MTTTIARQPAGQPTGGQFSAQSRLDGDVTLSELDGMLTADLAPMVQQTGSWYSNDSGAWIGPRADQIIPIDGAVPGPNHLAIHARDDGTYDAVAHFTGVDMTEWAGRHLALNPDDDDWQTEAANWLAENHDRIEEFWTRQGISAEGFEYDDEDLTVTVKLAHGATVNWNEVAATFNDSGAFNYLRQGLVGAETGLSTDLAAFLAGRPAEDLVRA